MANEFSDVVERFALRVKDGGSQKLDQPLVDQATALLNGRDPGAIHQIGEAQAGIRSSGVDNVREIMFRTPAAAIYLLAHPECKAAGGNNLQYRLDLGIVEISSLSKPYLQTFAPIHPVDVNRLPTCTQPAERADAKPSPPCTRAIELAVATQTEFQDALKAGTDKGTALETFRARFIQAIQLGDKLGLASGREAQQALEAIKKPSDSAQAKRDEADGFVTNALWMVSPKAAREAAQVKLTEYNQAMGEEARERVLGDIQAQYPGLAGGIIVKQNIYRDTEPVLSQKEKLLHQLRDAQDARLQPRMMYSAALRMAGKDNEALEVESDYELLAITGRLRDDP